MTIMDFDMGFEDLFNLVDIPIILAIMGLTYVFKPVIAVMIAASLIIFRWPSKPYEERIEMAGRFMPVVVGLLGVLAAVIFTPAGAPWKLLAKNIIYYAGAADLFYTFVWQTVLNKVNVFELIVNGLQKLKVK